MACVVKNSRLLFWGQAFLANNYYSSSVINSRILNEIRTIQYVRPRFRSGNITSKKEFKFVEAYLPKAIVPDPPRADSQSMTPSGWIAQDESKYKDLPYYVARTKNHMMPIYITEKYGHNLKFTQIKFIEGDIWALEKGLIAVLERKYPTAMPILSQVHEPGRWLKIRGNYTDDVAEYLLQEGL